MTNPADEVLFTALEAATFWDVSRSTIWWWVDQQGIKPVRRDWKRHGGPALYRFADLANAERVMRASPMGRPRKSTRLDDN